MSFLLTAQAVAAEKLRLTWDEAGRKISRKNVTLILPDGVEVSGKVVEFQPGGMSLDIRKTSNRSAHPKGRALIARQDISAVQFSLHGFVWQLVGTGAGFVGGGYLGVEAALRTYGDENSAGLKVAVAVWAGITALGFLLGRVADHKTILIEIIPEKVVAQ